VTVVSLAKVRAEKLEVKDESLKGGELGEIGPLYCDP
jgi:hypothetical protein